MKFNPNQSIVERHIRGIFGLEEAQARILLAQYKDALDEIKARLLNTPDNTFTEARLSSTMNQIESGILALESRINGEILDSFNMAHEQGIDDAVSEINKFESEFTGSPSNIPLGQILSSTESRNILLNQYSESMSAYNTDIRAEINRVLTQGIIQQKTYSQVVNDVDASIRGSLWRAHRITRTELHNIYNISKMDGMVSIRDQYIPDLKKMLVHPMDKRTAKDSKYIASQNPIVDIDKPFKYKWNGKERIFMNPPDRPNDRSIMIPYRPVYEQQELDLSK